ncbi:S41 family peptidase [Microbulbifer sp. 2201CG32-9]|uniref:S41 family peptidase n=1 Tax=Microbulbifer sp. 2201CG32-9 TaxID=3232309 RepID=UPI00345C212F
MVLFRGFSLVLCLLFASQAAYALPESDIPDWIEDIDHYQQQLEARHINLYHTIPQRQFDEALTRLKASLGEIDEPRLLVELMKISRLVGDGHTQVAYWEQEIDLYPFRFVNIDGALFLTGSGPAHKHLLGYRLSAIDGMPIEKVMDKLSPVAQGVENPHSLKVRLAWHINIAQFLYALDITGRPDLANYTFVNDNGEKEVVPTQSASMSRYHRQVTASLIPKKIPLGAKRVIESENLWMSADDSQQVAYIYFRRYPSYSDMEDFAEDIADYLQDRKIKNLIIDLRDNGGGDFFVGLLMARSLVLVDTIDWDHGVYTLIGNKTFSAGMSNAAQYRQLLNAKLVGEPTGANPVGYQDMDQFSLPNSDWTITYSKRNYRFQDADTKGVQPDVLIKQNLQDYKQGLDQPLAWVLRDINKRQNGAAGTTR